MQRFFSKDTHTHKAKNTKEKGIELDFIKVKKQNKKFCSSKNTFMKIKTSHKNGIKYLWYIYLMEELYSK